MTESEFKRLFEKHAKNVVREIITPIENKIRAQIHDVDTTLIEIIITKINQGGNPCRG